MSNPQKSHIRLGLILKSVSSVSHSEIRFLIYSTTLPVHSMSHTVNFAEETVRSSLEDKAFTMEQEFADVEVPSDKEVRKIVHKVDRRLISICGLLVAISLLDRTNLAYANIVGYVSLRVHRDQS